MFIFVLFPVLKVPPVVFENLAISVELPVPAIFNIIHKVCTCDAKIPSDSLGIYVTDGCLELENASISKSLKK